MVKQKIDYVQKISDLLESIQQTNIGKKINSGIKNIALSIFDDVDKTIKKSGNEFSNIISKYYKDEKEKLFIKLNKKEEKTNESKNFK